jgi:hypothetical protein
VRVSAARWTTILICCSTNKPCNCCSHCAERSCARLKANECIRNEVIHLSSAVAAIPAKVRRLCRGPANSFNVSGAATL